MTERENTVRDKRVESAQKVIDECFWGDYEIDAATLLGNIIDGDEKFLLFVLSKIIDNASHPSGLIRDLFRQNEVERLLPHLAAHVGTRRERTILSVRRNVLGEKTEIPELSWRR